MSEDEKKKKRGGGRPVSKSNLFNHPLAHGLLTELAQRKATNEECAQRMGVSMNTWKRWKTKHTELWAGMGARPELDDDSVEVALLDSARGYTKIVRKYDENGIETLEERYFPPNVAATTFYLKNRRSDRWRDKIDIAASMEQIPVRINFKRKEKVIEADSNIVPERKEITSDNNIPEDQLVVEE